MCKRVLKIVIVWMVLAMLAVPMAYAGETLVGIMSDGSVFVNQKAVQLDSLQSALRQAESIRVLSSEKANVASVQEVFAVCKALGKTHVTLETTVGEPAATFVELKFSLDKPSYQVGDSKTLKVELINHGSVAISTMELELDRQSISLYAKTGSMLEAGTWTRLHGEWGRTGEWTPKEFETVTVQPETSISWAIRVPALSEGVWEWSASYAGLHDQVIRSQAVSVQVSALDDATIATVELKTNAGTVIVELLPEDTTGTALNFAHSVLEGKYDGIVFHRVIKDFMIQGGDPDGNGMGSFGYSIPYENSTTKHVPGILSMARSQPKDSAGSQFFLMHGVSAHLDGGYCAFGRTLEGLDVVNEIANCEVGGPQKSSPVEKQSIITGRIIPWKK